MAFLYTQRCLSDYPDPQFGPHLGERDKTILSGTGSTAEARNTPPPHTHTNIHLTAALQYPLARGSHFALPLGQIEPPGFWEGATLEAR